MARAIGIDLGTTNSCAAIVEDGVPRVIPWPNGAKTIPSVFAIDKSGKRLIGDEAKEQAAANPENTIAAAKRLIGRSFGSEAVEQMSQVFTYELVEGDDAEVLIKVANQVMTLEQVSAAILARIKENAEVMLGDRVESAVITVPAYFNDRQRQAVRAAGKLAGLNVLRVLNEPTAAALAYGLGRALNQRVCIYDLGGGTFDVCIIDIKEKVFEVVRTGGDTFLGGVDFDDRVMQHVLQSFYEEHGIDLSYDRVAITRIRDACERAKITLSETFDTEILLPAIAEAEDGSGPIDFRMPITRDQLEELTGDLVERSIETCAQVFREAATSVHQVDELLLVGGQSRMPLVRRRLEEFLGRPPSTKVHPDEAVALGAAVMAHSLGGRKRRSGAEEPADKKDVTLLDVLPVPIGISKPDGTMHVLFPKNEPLPAKKSRLLTTSKDNQRSLSLRLYQGEDARCDRNELLGSFAFHGLRDGPKGSVRIEVTFHIDSEGLLNLSAKDKDTGAAVASQLKLSDDDGTRKKTERSDPWARGAARAPAAEPEAGAAAKASSPKAPPPAPPLPPQLPPMTPTVAPPERQATLADLPLPPPSATATPATAAVPPPGSRAAEGTEAPAEPVVRDSLRSQMRRPAPVVEEEKKPAGLVGWFKKMIGR